MGSKQENFRRVREEYAEKAQRAEAKAEARRAEVSQKFPDLAHVENELSHFGAKLLTLLRAGTNPKEQVARLQRENEELLARRKKLLRQHGYPENYCDIQYECPKCGDTGYRDLKMCSCMKRRLIELGMESSGMANLLRRQNFENFSLDYYKDSEKTYEIMKKNLEGAKEYAESFTQNSDSLLFFGGTGLGKTHLSSAIANRVLAKGYDVYYNSAVGMISDFERRRFGAGMAEEGDDTARYTECDLLIIDDLGTEVVNQFTLSCLYYVISTRLNLQKPTIVSTNLLSFSELRKTYSDRIVSRLMGEYVLFPFLGTDVRKQKLQ
ncbi:MAG: ATP-binding protein [Clostridia bacterium]|nr:ATP-binding protein [Clostridia bacterium]